MIFTFNRYNCYRYTRFRCRVMTARNRTQDDGSAILRARIVNYTHLDILLSSVLKRCNVKLSYNEYISKQC